MQRDDLVRNGEEMGEMRWTKTHIEERNALNQEIRWRKKCVDEKKCVQKPIILLQPHLKHPQHHANQRPLLLSSFLPHHLHTYLRNQQSILKSFHSYHPSSSMLNYLSPQPSIVDVVIVVIEHLSPQPIHHRRRHRWTICRQVTLKPSQSINIIAAHQRHPHNHQPDHLNLWTNQWSIITTTVIIFIVNHQPDHLNRWTNHGQLLLATVKSS